MTIPCCVMVRFNTTSSMRAMEWSYITHLGLQLMVGLVVCFARSRL
ncbi:hypothetical protein LINGRAHAP2_LOCUS7638 [Linum grandiflorum]